MINFFKIDDRWMFVDLPGYGYAKVPARIRNRWAPMVEEFLLGDRRLELTIMIVDARHEPTDLDIMLKEWMEHSSIPHQVVATKSDKLSRGALARSIRLTEETLSSPVLPYSAMTGAGKRELWRIIDATHSQ